jgi:hypothetical protein
MIANDEGFGRFRQCIRECIPVLLHNTHSLPRYASFLGIQG